MSKANCTVDGTDLLTHLLQQRILVHRLSAGARCGARRAVRSSRAVCSRCALPGRCALACSKWQQPA
jgi:hypothetical protein